MNPYAGVKEYPYYKAILINPALFFKYNNSWLYLNKEASSNPPGINAKLYPFFIILVSVYLSTPDGFPVILLTNLKKPYKSIEEKQNFICYSSFLEYSVFQERQNIPWGWIGIIVFLVLSNAWEPSS